jgi:hypothetical protein
MSEIKSNQCPGCGEPLVEPSATAIQQHKAGCLEPVPGRLKDIHPVDALKGLGVEMSPHVEAALRERCDEPVVEIHPYAHVAPPKEGRVVTELTIQAELPAGQAIPEAIAFNGVKFIPLAKASALIDRLEGVLKSIALDDPGDRIPELMAEDALAAVKEWREGIQPERIVLDPPCPPDHFTREQALEAVRRVKMEGRAGK